MFDNERKMLLDVVNFEEPKITETVVDERHSRFVISPLIRGFGTTVGNSLRRVLLSSMPGAAVISTHINGVLHEFTAIPGVKEDVCEIILNLKGITANLFSNAPKKAYIQVTGPCEVTAADIQCDDELRIIDKDHHIATVGQGGTLSMELTFDRGVGYVSGSKNKEKYDGGVLGEIFTDSIFTPVLKVEYTVESARIGSNIENDRLVLDVYTDGSMTPAEAVALSSKILIGHFSLLCGSLVENGDKMPLFKPSANEEKQKLLDRKITEEDFSVRSFNCLKRAGVDTVGDITRMTEENLLKIRNLGKSSLDDIIGKLTEWGLELAKD